MSTWNTANVNTSRLFYLWPYRRDCGDASHFWVSAGMNLALVCAILCTSVYVILHQHILIGSSVLGVGNPTGRQLQFRPLGVPSPTGERQISHQGVERAQTGGSALGGRGTGDCGSPENMPNSACGVSGRASWRRGCLG